MLTIPNLLHSITSDASTNLPMASYMLQCSDHTIDSLNHQLQHFGLIYFHIINDTIQQQDTAIKTRSYCHTQTLTCQQ